MIGDKIDALLADKGYDADAVRQALNKMEVEAIIPSNAELAMFPPVSGG